MQNSLIVYKKAGYLISAGFKNGRLVDIDFEKENSFSTGSIYVGYIVNVLPHLKCAYVDIGLSKPCYMEMEDGFIYCTDKKHSDGKIHPGDNIIVMISKESKGSKPISVTPELSVTTPYCVVTLNRNKTYGISSKIKDSEKKKELRKVLSSFISEDISIIARTLCENSNIDLVAKSMESSICRLRNIIDLSHKRTKGSCIYRSDTFFMNIRQDVLNNTYEKVMTDSREIFNTLEDFFQEESSRSKLTFYLDESYSLAALFNMKSHLSELIKERVWLKSGADLVIQKTEALYSIDVNTSKASASKMKNGFIGINIEAAEEIIRQLKLRNLSGIILVDFINMNGTDTKVFYERLKVLCKADKLIQLHDITKLGLVEITRSRRKQPYEEVIKEVLEE